MLDPERENDGNGSRSGEAALKAVEPGTVETDGVTEVDVSPPRGHDFPVVGIGGSAGALDAFTRFLRNLRDDTGMAFVFVQHLDPHHESQLPEILANNTTMPVHSVTDGMAVRPNEVFVIPPNVTMILQDGTLGLTQRAPGLHLPINAFFESLASVQGGRAVGVVLSGNASDGSLGVKAIKAECGVTFAQSEETAQHLWMPRNAIATGAVDFVLSPSEIAKELNSLSHHPFIQILRANRPEQEVLPEGVGDLQRIFQVLKTGTKVDFLHYKPNTVRRRIGRRMIVRRAGTLHDYADFIESHPDEVRELYRDLLVSVTSFFRDPKVFESLTRVLADVLRSRQSGEPFRIWVPGCATGEEAYSLAICVQELIDELKLRTPIQIFGTDISDIALDRARTGYYPEVIAQDVSAERLRRFFFRTDRGYQIVKSTREVCIFARQDVNIDPPFGHIDLVSCRNLLIYLDSTLQRRVLPIFHYSLNSEGLLMLGTAESIAAASDLFEPIDKQHRIYMRKAAPVRLAYTLAVGGGIREVPPSKPRTSSGEFDVQKSFDLVIQSKYAPAAVVIDSGFQILHFRGRTGFYLEPSSGEATFNLLHMVRTSLVATLRRAVHVASTNNVSVQETGIKVENQNEMRQVDVEVTPIGGSSPDQRHFVVVFQSAGSADRSEQKTGPVQLRERVENESPLEAQVIELQKQVGELREQLRSASEEHEAHAEELGAANEEVSSANEELQSTNEELGTTKEELQSANEELNTLNEELHDRNHELTTVNSDLLNLLAAVDVAFLMVDKDLRLRRFSATAEKYVGAKATDIGYPLTHVNSAIDLAGLLPQMRKVVETLSVDQREVQSREGRWFSATIRPYRTADDRIAGAVLVFVDIDPLKRMLRSSEKARDFAEGMVETVREPLLVLDRDLRIQRATAAFYEMFGVLRGETEGRLLYDLGNGQWNDPRLRELLGLALFRNTSFLDFEIEHEFPHIGKRTIRLNARRIFPANDEDRRVLLAIEDVTQPRHDAEVRYKRLFETAKDGLLLFNAETKRVTDVNPAFLELTGFRRDQLVGKTLEDLECFHEAAPSTDFVARTNEQDVVWFDSVCLNSIEGRRIDVEIVANRYLVGRQEIVQANFRDVTQRKQALKQLRESEERFRLFVDSVKDYALFQMDLHGRVVAWNAGAERLLGYNEAEIVGKSCSSIFTPEDVASGEDKQEMETAREKGRSEDDRWQVRKDGSRFFASGILTSVRDAGGVLLGFAKIMRDTTERMKAEERLKQQAHLLELSQDLIIVRKVNGAISFWNNSAAEKYGWTKEEAMGQVTHTLLRTAFPEPLSAVEATLFSRGHWEGELLHTRRDGVHIPVWSRWALQRGSNDADNWVLEINSDITERQRADRQLRASLREKEVLLKEIHHRVKNNLQVISSLLSLQAESLDDPFARGMLEQMNTRVRSIAAIHEVLYGAADFSRIDFSTYLNRLANDLTAVYSDQIGGVSVSVEAGPILLDITQAVPCGLIVNELLTNSFKHAFRNKASGKVEISFECIDQVCALQVADDGVGLPDDVALQNSKSMGLQLFSLLVMQIKAEVDVDRSAGTRFKVVFPRKPV